MDSFTGLDLVFGSDLDPKSRTRTLESKRGDYDGVG